MLDLFLTNAVYHVCGERCRDDNARSSMSISPSPSADRADRRALVRPIWCSTIVNILLVEDDEVIAELVQMGLEEARFTVEVARDGISGLERALDGEYDLIILDLMLPGRDGWSI